MAQCQAPLGLKGRAGICAVGGLLLMLALALPSSAGGAVLNLINNPEFEVTLVNPSGTEFASRREDTPATPSNPRYTVNNTNASGVGWYNTAQVIEVWTPSFQNSQLGTNLGSNISEINSIQGASQLYLTFTADYAFDYDFSWVDVNRNSGGPNYRTNINTGTTPIGTSGVGNTFSNDYTATVSVFTPRSDTVTLERGQTYTLSFSTSFANTLSALLGEVNLVTPVAFVYWDMNGTSPGSGGPSPNGTWNASNSNWSDAPDGTGPMSSFANNDVAVFSAGSDATGSYTVTKSGRTDVNGIVFADGTPTIAHGNDGRIHFEATNGGETFVETATGVTATIETRITDQGSDGLVKFGGGTLVLAGNQNSQIDGTLTVEAGTLELANTHSQPQFRGAVQIDGGTLLITQNNQIADGSAVTLNGGALEIRNAVEDVGTLTLSADSTIDFTGSTGTLAFDASDANPWTGSTTLTINNWGGNLNGNGADQLFVGTNTSGLTSSQLGQIQFFNPVGLNPGFYDARMLASGEVVPFVPIPEPGTYAIGGLLLLGALASFIRRRLNSSAP